VDQALHQLQGTLERDYQHKLRVRFSAAPCPARGTLARPMSSAPRLAALAPQTPYICVVDSSDRYASRIQARRFAGCQLLYRCRHQPAVAAIL
jgi:hypothetical protein